MGEEEVQTKGHGQGWTKGRDGGTRPSGCIFHGRKNRLKVQMAFSVLATGNFRSLRDSQGDMSSGQSQQLKERAGPGEWPEEECKGVDNTELDEKMLSDGSWGLPKWKRRRENTELLGPGTGW